VVGAVGLIWFGVEVYNNGEAVRQGINYGQLNLKMLSNEELIETNGRDNQGWVLLGRLYGVMW